MVTGKAQRRPEGWRGHGHSIRISPVSGSACLVMKAPVMCDTEYKNDCLDDQNEKQDFWVMVKAFTNRSSECLITTDLL